jgi:DNA polymerase-3 subunit alpha
MDDLKNKIKTGFTASLHTHVASMFDASIEGNALCARIKELGGKGCVITDHGVLSSIEDYRRIFDKNGLKLVPGCELYVDGGILGRLHLIVIAKNDNGYRGICHIVTESNYSCDGDYPVIAEDKLLSMLREYKGDIFVLTACMQGVLSAIFLQNETIEKKISKLKKKQENYLSMDSKPVADSSEAVRKWSAKVEELTALRDETKIIAEQKFAKREKAIEKAEKNGEDVSAAKAELIADKKKAAQAADKLAAVKAGLDTAKKELNKAAKTNKEMLESAEKYGAIDEQINTLKKSLKPDEELEKMAEEKATVYLDAVGKGRFLAEVQYHGIPQEAVCFPKVAKVAKKLNIPLIATNDVHILNNTADDRLLRQVLRSMRFGSQFEDESVGDSELYLKDNSQLYDALVQILLPEDAVAAINNIDVLFNSCSVEFVTGKHYPKYVE